MRKTIAFILAIILFSIAAYAAITAVQITKDISLQKTEDCKIVEWQEEEPVYGTCTNYYEGRVCDDEPLNTSCQVKELSYNYQCKTGTTKVTRSKQICREKDLQILVDNIDGKKAYNINYGDWGKCSYSAIDDTLTIICDSKYDGNNDGICQSGESCIKFEINKGGTTRSMKNSKDEWAADDGTFFLEKLEIEVV